MQKSLGKIKEQLDSTENILCTLQCSFDQYVNRNCARPGILVATEQRMIFYGTPFMNFKNEIVEEFLYEGISSFTLKKNIFGIRIRMQYNDEFLKFNKITNADATTFVETVNILRKK
ncbi:MULTISPECIES: PH domain-containing protein [Bacillus cereus group]|uniref:PH domain-containing protein n=1 Tax=Bacillus cereus group TaxID=86661 RepID=UPI0007B6D0C5|nr:PH domain-containing protein [Bacillus cereus]ANC11209.1 hypothetical protein WR47_29355 [Bacillus cereus]ANC17026.1 hypothetical protein WR51_29310 [Bacillus cereus]MDA1997003.1 PH domain-containing protein [Bacillus cereus]MDA2002829.1 PH domain-containing protein [Bacillus cereus]MDA3655555.1 PH domain-containing protein [Bacillus cereus]